MRFLRKALSARGRTLDAAAPPRPFELLMLGLSIYVLAALAAAAFLPLSPASRTILGYMDFAVCLAFLAEFGVRLARAENRAAFLKWGWIDLVASIPTLDVARMGRAARIIRIIRVLRAVRSLRRIGPYLLQRRGEAVFSAAALIAVLMITFAAMLILEVEAGRENANIQNPADALWWAVTTITTVGYGDHYPVTPAGRVVAAVLMTIGVGFFGVFTGLVATWFLSPAQRHAAELAEIRTQLDAVLRALDAAHRREAAAAHPSAAETPPSAAP